MCDVSGERIDFNFLEAGFFYAKMLFREARGEPLVNFYCKVEVFIEMSFRFYIYNFIKKELFHLHVKKIIYIKDKSTIIVIKSSLFV